MVYDQAFFDMIRPGCQSSAGVVAQEVFELLHPATVVDVGCGEGWWGKAFEDLGCVVTGIDGAGTQSVLTDFHAADLDRMMNTVELAVPYDLAVCLEVAEHLSPGRACGFVGDLCVLSDVVLFSAAIPRQGGVHHRNEQWPAYWAEWFQQNGFVVSGGLRWRIWDDGRVENWYRQNLLLAVSANRQDLLTSDLFSGPHNQPIPVVHPVLWESRQ